MTSAAGIVNHASSAVQMRSPATSTRQTSTTITTIDVSITSTDTSRDPERARIMATPTAPNSATHGTTATTARRSMAARSPTVVRRSPAPLRYSATTPRNHRRHTVAW